MARGIYCVAFGDPARSCARALMQSIRKHLGRIPICLAADRKIGPEDQLITLEDGRGKSDIGGRRAKLRAYELAPAEWEAVLYLDADTEIVPPADIERYFEWIEAGWEFVICKDPHLMDKASNYARRNNRPEMAALKASLTTLNVLMWNGGVWAFGRNERIARFFRRWQKLWENKRQRDQGPLLDAMYAEPLRMLVLGNEWNTFPKYSKGVETAGLMHYPGRARRWRGLINGGIDGAAAWQAVERFNRRRQGRARSTR